MDELLAKGYFPGELPPSFGTVDYSVALSRNLAQLPREFRSPRIAKLCKFSLARGNSRFRRRLALPNPQHYFNICECIITNWPALDAFLGQSPICKSTPTRIPQRSRAVSPRHNLGQLYPLQANARAGCKTVLHTDITDFYPSIYSHSIPWALHSKATAKADRTNMALFGNRLDLLMRNSQDGQTLGIPIGPDTSFIIAEVLLAAADIALTQHIPTLNGYRWIDEFRFAFDGRSGAEHAYAVIERTLLDFELRLNPRKTQIADLPVAFESTWTSELRAFRFRSSAMGQAGDLIRYFDQITTYVNESPNEHVVKYGIARLRTFAVHNSNQALFQALLCQVLAFEPGAIRECLEAIHYAEAHHGLVVDRALLQNTINTVISQNARVGHDYEVSWCIWAAITWILQLDVAAAQEISTMENSIVAILALDAEQQGLITPGALNTTNWAARMTEVDLYEEEWLLAYEANVQGWLPTVGGGDHVSADAGFGFLKANGVRFYAANPVPIVPGALIYPP